MKTSLKLLIALLLSSWLFTNFAYWAFHQPQYSWLFDVNASMFGFIWAISIFALLIWFLVSLEEL